MLRDWLAARSPREVNAERTRVVENNCSKGRQLRADGQLKAWQGGLDPDLARVTIDVNGLLLAQLAEATHAVDAKAADALRQGVRVRFPPGAVSRLSHFLCLQGVR